MDVTDEQDDQQRGEPEAPKLSAAFLPYDDERLWLGMPQDQRRRSRPKKRRQQARASAGEMHDGSPPSRASILSRPISFGRKQIAAAVLTLALPISAFAVTGAISGDVEIPDAPVAITSDPVTIAVSVDIAGLRADRVTPKRVEISWDAPALEGPLMYALYRDGVVIAETDQASFIDIDVEPQRYYYYAVSTVGSDGTAASSPQLLVAVPSETGELPEGPAPAAPAPITIVTSTSSRTSSSPSPSKTPSPTGSKIVWPSTDFGGGGGGGNTATSTQTTVTQTATATETTTATTATTTATETTTATTATETTTATTATETTTATTATETTTATTATTVGTAIVAGATDGCDPDAESCLATGASLAIWLLLLPLIVSSQMPWAKKRKLRDLKNIWSLRSTHP